MNELMSEGFDLRRFLLLSLKRVWMLIVGALIGALLFGSFRFLKQSVFAAEPLYRNDTLYMIEFDEETQEETQLYFNDYTWNDVIDSDRIAGAAVSLLDGITREQIAAATTVPTMSDIRLFHIYVDYSDPETADLIQNALEIALGSFSYRERGFDSISVWTRGSAKLLIETSTIKRWAVAGAIIGALIACFVLAAKYILDDSIRLVADVERTGAKCLGVLFKGIRDEKEEDALKKALEEELKDCGELRIVDPAGTAVSEECAEHIHSILPEEIKTNDPSPAAKKLYCLVAGSISQAEFKRQLKGEAEAVVLCEASKNLHNAYYFYGIKKNEQS